MSASESQVCPVVGTTNSTLPPSHPDVDLSRPGQTCPVVGASTDHHHNLHKHPSVPIPDDKSPHDASACPALKKVVQEPKSQQMDDDVCPVVGTATTVLPPDHPSTEGKGDDAECPVTKAKVGHHKGKIVGHPDISHTHGTCPVAGIKV
ncbi:hypothetical protein BR93DRAFT_980521 [Coniochaeta sp. PMI_546]|nr:hypothetical protein BR93DRAFT_980521 [Coniochaeta sp. PMI_546]